MEDFNEEISKPSDWPANAREASLENIHNAVVRFIDDPGYETREVIVSLTGDYDLNQRSSVGLHRVTDYEISMLNSLYIYASMMCFGTLKAYIYEVVGDTARMQKMVSQIDPSQPLEIEQCQYLMPGLKLYYLAYQQFTVLKNKSFANQIIDVINRTILETSSQTLMFELTHAYVTLLSDLSSFRCKKRTSIWAFSRKELIKLFGLEAKLIKMNKDSAVARPLKGVLMMTISNYILKSRNEYNGDYICKYISKDVAKSAINNHEIWMQKIEYLNDKREMKVIQELFSSKQWLQYDWVKKIDFTLRRNYYVSSFCKNIKDETMSRKYGSCVYGYKNDRIADLLAPLAVRVGKNGQSVPFFSQVVAFDIIYDIQEAQQEINYLCKIIDLFELTSKEKNDFLEEILQYWILSVKDKKWAYERERRYVLFLYDDYHYIELQKDHERFLKLKTSLLILPDFILGDHPNKESLNIISNNKRTTLSIKDYMFCSNCLSCDYDAIYGNNDICPICGSKDFKKVYVNI